MLILDVTPVQPDGPAAIVFTDTQTRTRQSGTLKARQIGVCKAVPNSAPLPPVGERGDYMMSPSAAVQNYFLMYENRAITRPLKVAVIHGPKHGKLADEGADELDHTFSYRPKPGYIGEDRATVVQTDSPDRKGYCGGVAGTSSARCSADQGGTLLLDPCTERFAGK